MVAPQAIFGWAGMAGSLMGTVTIMQFILEEAQQTLGMAIYTLRKEEAWDAMAALLPMMQQIYTLQRYVNNEIGILSPWSQKAFSVYLDEVHHNWLAFHKDVFYGKRK